MDEESVDRPKSLNRCSDIELLRELLRRCQRPDDLGDYTVFWLRSCLRPLYTFFDQRDADYANTRMHEGTNWDAIQADIEPNLVRICPVPENGWDEAHSLGAGARSAYFWTDEHLRILLAHDIVPVGAEVRDGQLLFAGERLRLWRDQIEAMRIAGALGDDVVRLDVDGTLWLLKSDN